MSCRLIISPDAETDISEAAIWYEQRVTGLGLAFARMIETRLSQLTHDPQLFRKLRGPYRLAATTRFPYAIYFIWDEAASLVTVRRVLHFKRHHPPRL